MDIDKIKNLRIILENYHKKFDKGSNIWSFVYHFCLFGTTILTLLIAFLLNSEFFDGIFGINKNDSIALMALMAAVLSALIAKGGLNAKWRSYRINRSNIEILIIQLSDDNPNYIKVKEDLEKIILGHDMAIVNSSMDVNEKVSFKEN